MTLTAARDKKLNTIYQSRTTTTFVLIALLINESVSIAHKTNTKSSTHKTTKTGTKSQTPLTESIKCHPMKPINLEFPLKSRSFRPEFKYIEVESPKVEKIYKGHFRLHEDFGILILEGRVYFLNQMDIFSPSIHTVAGIHSQMEIQVQGFTKDNKLSTNVVLLFDEGPITYPPLFGLGIGENMISKLSEKVKDPKNSFLTLSSRFNLRPLLDGVADFLMYKGDDLIGMFEGLKDTGQLNKRRGMTKRGCPKTTYLIMFEKLWVSRQQLEEFGGEGFGVEFRHWKGGEFDKKIDLFANFDFGDGKGSGEQTQRIAL